MGMPTDLQIVDLGIGFPYTSVEQKMSTYDFFRANLKDAESLREMEFPAQYMFKDVPDIVPEGTDVVEWVVEKMDAYNIGIGRGYSVREVVEACRRVSGVNFKAKDGERRAGDPPSLYADPAKIKRELNWSAKHQSLDAIVESAWRWHKQNPHGYPRSG